MSDWQSEIPHILTVTEGDSGADPPVNYEVQHLAECDTFELDSGGFGHECGVQYVIEGLGEPWCYTGSHDEHLPVGTYEVRFDHHTYPATPNGPEEYDAWLDVERVDLADLPVID